MFCWFVVCVCWLCPVIESCFVVVALFVPSLFARRKRARINMFSFSFSFCHNYMQWSLFTLISSPGFVVSRKSKCCLVVVLPVPGLSELTIFVLQMK